MDAEALVAHAFSEVFMSVSRKVMTLDQLLQLRAQARAQGQVVVHCHGCFDIVHPGHIHHLQSARALGDVLVVTVSSDANVNKGVNRPLIPDDLRAGSLAALECVDWVFVNPDPTAVQLLGKLQPDVYVKGREYEKNKDPRFLDERDTVLSHGGRVVFSSGEVIYSSTALIGSLERTDTFNDEKLTRYRHRFGLDDATLTNIVQRFRAMKTVVIGDYIQDRYQFVDPTGIAGEGPMMALRALHRRDFDGGAGVVALHMASMGAATTLVTSLADDEASAQVLLRLRGQGVEVRACHSRTRLVSKTRFISDQQKLFKLDEGASQPLDSRAESELVDHVMSVTRDAQCVVFADFGYGTITSGLLERVLPELRRTVPFIAADVSGRQSNLLRFRDVDLLCPTEREVRETLHDFNSGLGAVVWNLMNQTGARQTFITLGKNGLVTFEPETGCPSLAEAAKNLQGRLRSEYLPSLATQAIDPLGCGDALLATASLTLGVGGSLQAAALLGSIAAAVEVRRLGNEPVSDEEVIGFLTQGSREQTPARIAG
jgi:rfaE bifunctional protein kinase chain/domain/rfaE bifunctional protein nucleotidyltransferase chain/domain